VWRYALWRLLQGLGVMFAVSVIGFAILHLAPGGPLAVYATTTYMRAEDMARLQHELGLDQPLPVQYLRWVTDLLQGNWGRSYRDGSAVLAAIGSRLPATVELMLVSLTLAVILGVAVGILGAVKKHSIFDYLATTGAMVALSVPTFWFGLMVIFLFAEVMGVLPSGDIATIGRPFSLLDRMHHLVGPSAVLGLVLLAPWSRYARSAMLEVLHEDYIRSARAKGLSEQVVLLRHAFRNVLIPLIILAGVQLPLLFGGALVTETVFSWPGMGRFFVDSLGYRDYPVIMGILLSTTLLVVVGNLIADLLCALADPRIHIK
jgi:peptide/nickel transport system permease protein